MQTSLGADIFPQAGTPTALRRDAVLAALLAGCLGVVLILGVGFIQAQSVHDAAHDTRHAIGFPCH